LFDFSLAPFEGSCLFVVSTDEVIDRFTQLFDIDKAGSLERLAAQNASTLKTMAFSGGFR
jgi:hypothetical protein